MALLPLAVQTYAQPLFRAGIVADIQYADIETKGTRHYRSSIAKLQEAIGEFKKENVDRVISLGDLIDQHFDSYDTLLQILDNLDVPVWHILGNHDFSVKEDKKKEIPGMLGLRKRYGSFIQGNWRFLCLDGTDVTIFGSSDRKKINEARIILDSLIEAKAPNAREWNGGIGDKQLKWIKRQLSLAEKEGNNIVLLCHFPIYPANDPHNLWNAGEVRTLLENFNGKIAYFSGHTHKNLYSFNNGIHYVSFSGMVEEDRNSFAIAEFYVDRIVIKGFGNSASHVIEWKD